MDALSCDAISFEQPESWQSKDKTDAQRSEIKRRAQWLSDGQRAPLVEKMDFASRVIGKAVDLSEKAGRPLLLNYSGGRDSTVLSHLLLRTRHRLEHVFVNTRMEYSETYRQIKKWRKALADEGVNLTTLLPDLRPGEVWKTEGVPLWSKKYASKYRQWYRTGNEAHLRGIPPTIVSQMRSLKERDIKVSDKCCDRLKKDPLKAYRKLTGSIGSLTGTRAQESQNRRLAYIQRGALYITKGHLVANPLVHWSREEIEGYLNKHDCWPILPESGGTGCVTCMFGCHLQDKHAMDRLKLDNPKMHQVAMEQWGFGAAMESLEPTEIQGELF